jgi:hypothetical protein
LLAADLLPAVAPGFRHNRSMPENKSERKGFVLLFSAHFSPHRSGFRLWVARRQQQLRLVRLQQPGRFFSARLGDWRAHDGG